MGKEIIKEIYQKRGFNFRKHTLYEDKVVVEYRNFNKTIKYENKIETLGTDLQYEKDSNVFIKFYFYLFVLTPIWYLVICILFSTKIEKIALFYCLILSLIVFSVNLFQQPKDDLFLVGNMKNLVFYRAIPNEKEVLDFIEQVILTTNKYLKEKYTKFDKYTLQENYESGLSWLLARNIILKSEFEELIEDFRIKQLLK